MSTRPESTSEGAASPWIEQVSEEAADGEVAELYRETRKKLGSVHNLHLIHSLHPGALRAFLAFDEAVLTGEGELTACEKELVAAVVSSENSCDYCTLKHMDRLRAEVPDPDLPRLAAFDFRSADLSDRQRAMLCYAVRLTSAPATIGPEHVEELREVGFTDAAILEIALVASYYNHLNRLVLGLGVVLETPEEEPTSHQPS